MAAAAPGPRLYRPRRPERTLLYRALASQQAKLDTGRLFMDRVLPRHSAHFASLMAGSASTMAFADAAYRRCAEASVDGPGQGSGLSRAA
jgi:hypothetical protein